MKFSLRVKIVLFVVVIASIIATVSIWISYNTYTKTIDEYYKTTLTNLARTAAIMMDADKIEQYYQTLEKDEEYDEYLDILFEIKENNDIKYLYIEKIVGNTAVAIMDADSSEEAMQLGDTFEISDGADTSSLNEGIPAFISNEEGVGWVCSIFVPITDENGEAVALVGADMSMDDVMNERAQFLRIVCIVIVFITVISVMLLLFIISRVIIKPINLLSEATANFVSDKEKNDHDVNKVSQISQLEVHTGDEIESLSKAIKTMELEINDYISNLTAVTAERERIGAELNVATQIQADMLPRIFPAFPDREEFDVFASMLPAKEVGGDFYDFFLVDDDHIAIVIADVSGKGVPAALFMVIAKTIIKKNAQSGMTPAEVFTNANEQLCEGNEAGLFVTAWMGVIEISSGKMTYVNAGHNPPCIQNGDGGYSFLKTRPGFVLAGMEGIRYRQYETQLSKGDMLYLYTDGVTEAVNHTNELYGDQRLIDALNRMKQLAPVELLKGIKTDLDDFVQEAPQFDDITMLAFQYRSRNDDDFMCKTFSSEISALNQVMDFIDAALVQKNASEKMISQVNIIADELVSNIIRYSKSEDFKVKCRVSEQEITLHFSDTGIPYDPLKYEEADITLSAEERPIGGLGIMMVKKMVDSIEYEHKEKQNLLKIVKRFI